MTDKNPNQTSTSTSKIDEAFEPLKELVLQDIKGLSYRRRNFIDACIAHAEDLRVRQRPSVELPEEMVQEDCDKFISIRDYLCDWIFLENDIVNEEIFSEMLVDILERLKNLKSNPPTLNSWHDTWIVAHSFFTYETFLYIIAALLKSAAYETLHEIYNSDYIFNFSDRYGQAGPRMFDCFYGHLRMPQNMILQKNGETCTEPVGELVRIQANRNDISFSDIRQAELLTLLISFITPNALWQPQTLLCDLNEGSIYPFFIRTRRHSHFLKLATITGTKSASQLKTKLREGEKKPSLSPDFYAYFTHEMNVENWDAEHQNKPVGDIISS